MAPVMPLPTAEAIAAASPDDVSAPSERLFWTRRVSLTTRILAVNIIALALMAGSLFYLDSYRKQLLAERFNLARTEAEITADALIGASPAQRDALFARVGKDQELRLRLYDRGGALVADSFALAAPSFAFVDPAREPWLKNAARFLDRTMDFALGATPIPAYRDPRDEHAARWPEIAAANAAGRTVVFERYAPDRTPVITAAAPVEPGRQTLLTSRNARDITQSVRDARQTLAIVIGAALILSVQLSLFLARTIVRPLRTLVRAAVRVRLGRDRAVVVPRLPERGDEIGLLARAVSDMTAALRQRIDAVESFAADVAHEIKNPLASLRSALESLERVEDPALRLQLSGIAAHDVQRIDRLVTEIADASRIDAELSRTTFVPVDLPAMTAAMIAARERRGNNSDAQITLIAPDRAHCIVSGDPSRLERVIENLLDNAVSFSPSGSRITVEIARHEHAVELAVMDGGPGIAPEQREKVFERFHSLRPAGESFGSHSGLGLAIARTIVAAHDGTLVAVPRDDGKPGARLVASFPAA